MTCRARLLDEEAPRTCAAGDLCWFTFDGDQLGNAA